MSPYNVPTDLKKPMMDRSALSESCCTRCSIFAPLIAAGQMHPLRAKQLNQNEDITPPEYPPVTVDEMKPSVRSAMSRAATSANRKCRRDEDGQELACWLQKAAIVPCDWRITRSRFRVKRPLSVHYSAERYSTAKRVSSHCSSITDLAQSPVVFPQNSSRYK